MKFFFDTCISPKAVYALKIVVEFQDVLVVPFKEKFSDPNTSDSEWITVLGKEGQWVIISGDPRISRGKAEKAAWRESGLTAFFFRDGWANCSIYIQASDLIRRWPDIVLANRNSIQGSGYLIPKKGDLQKIY
ncbi:MAG: hypothetical protein HY033_03975 [Ignavibacteriae bacterium]|nr:hypothetical protein [Ignavibacteria bacterium]MBI3364045.1 hypothetical protein [Ignavibacteriota bacterium]